MTNTLAVIGFLWLAAQALRFVHWRFRTNRDGLSGRFGKTWDAD